MRVQSLGRLAGRSQLWVKQAEGLYFWWHKQNVYFWWNNQKVSIFCETSRMSLFLAKQADLYFWNRENNLYFWWNKQKSLLFVKRQKVSTLMKQPESRNQPESLYFCWNRQKVYTFVLLSYFRLTAQFWANTGRHYRGRVACTVEVGLASPNADHTSVYWHGGLRSRTSIAKHFGGRRR